MVDEEPPLEPDRLIIDPHLHLWEILADAGQQAPQRFLFDECRQMLERSGHAVSHTVFVECHQMYRADGPEPMRPIGETEFANGIAAMSASGRYGACRIAHRIVGSADLRLGERVRPVLEAHVCAAGKRFRGIRMPTAWREEGLFGLPPDPAGRHILRHPAVADAARVLAAMDLSLDVWCLQGQLDEVHELAAAVPELVVVIDHCGTPQRSGGTQEGLADWAAGLRRLAMLPNTVIKLGGLGMSLDGPLGTEARELPSAELARRWAPVIEPAIEIFGADRAMFESNFPPDRDSGSYGATWNAFKRIVAGCSDSEKDALFRGTAARTYRIAI